VNPTLLLTAASLNKRLAIAIAATMLVVVSMPIIGVYALGSTTLSYLAHTLEGSDSTSAISTTTVGLYEGPDVAGNTYAWGNCTYWVYALRLQAGDPIPTTWGNAATWAPRAAADGYTVDHIPSVGAIMQTPNSAGGLGHVAYVTAVDSTNGAWTISEMNVKGLDVVDITTYPASADANYNFIHDKGLLP
jgi:surface antigen